jgi:hypothetical protein
MLSDEIFRYAGMCPLIGKGIRTVRRNHADLKLPWIHFRNKPGEKQNPTCEIVAVGTDDCWNSRPVPPDVLRKLLRHTHREGVGTDVVTLDEFVLILKQVMKDNPSAIEDVGSANAP